MEPLNARPTERSDAAAASSQRRVILFDLFGVIAEHQRPGALAAMAARCEVDELPFTDAYWSERPPYDAGAVTADAYWRGVLASVGVAPTDPLIRALRTADVESWSGMDAAMVRYVGRLVDSGAEVALLSNIPTDLAVALRSTQGWLADLALVALSAEIGAAKPEARAFLHCLELLDATPSQVLFVDDRAENTDAAAALGFNTSVFTSLDALIPVIDAWIDRTHD